MGFGPLLTSWSDSKRSLGFAKIRRGGGGGGGGEEEEEEVKERGTFDCCSSRFFTLLACA